MNQYYLLQIYGNPISIDYLTNNINENLAYDIVTRFPSWRVKIVCGENIELQLIIKKMIATETKIMSLKNKMSEHYTVFCKDKDNFISVTDFDSEDTQEYIYELESIDNPIPESPKNQKKEGVVNEKKLPSKTDTEHKLLHTIYHVSVISLIIYIINYIL
jgi:hypothetical protein